ncbi:hypothetical protein ACSBR1_020720 [Camellia fascicularis]
MVKWNEVTLNKSQEGLRVRDIGRVNECLLLKWWWRYGKEDRALWKQVLCNKYGKLGGRWALLSSKSGMVSKVWQDMSLVGASNSALADFYVANFKIVVGDGIRIHLWFDKWHNNLCLREEFPRLFSLSDEKEGLLCHFYHRKGASRDWKLTFRRALLAWEEEEEVKRLYDMLVDVPNVRIVWRILANGWPIQQDSSM